LESGGPGQGNGLPKKMAAADGGVLLHELWRYCPAARMASRNSFSEAAFQ
jgi:hypothetical protein